MILAWVIIAQLLAVSTGQRLAAVFDATLFWMPG